MAANKECLIIILDIRQTADDTFKQKSFKCAAEILKDKICSGKKDYVSFVILGSKETSNSLNKDVCHDGYLNIKQYQNVQIPTWQLLINYFKLVNEEPTDSGEWLDAVVVAMEMIKCHKDLFNFHRQRIVLFYDFNGEANDYDNYDIITENMIKANIGLTVVSHNIAYMDNSENEESQAVFRHAKKSQEQVENEKYALRLVTNCNAKLCNFKEALNIIFKVENPRPWCWNSTLTIGSKINIKVSGIIVIKDESNIKLKKCWAEADEQVARETRFFIKGNEVCPLEGDLLNGFMLGGTPIVYDEEIQAETEPQAPGLKFLGFAKRNTIPEEYFMGDSLYWIIHQRNMTVSAKKLDALVKALLHTKKVIICWKIFSLKFNAPKLVILLPNQMHPDKPASLSMVELSHHAQHHFWDFPALCTKRTECSSEQLEAIDNLIDSMDLVLNPKLVDEPRDTYQTDILPYNAFPHIFEQNVMDILERKIICNASENDEQFQEMLKDKNFVDVFWKVPESNEEKAKNAVKAVKQLFALDKGSKWVSKINPSKSKNDIKSEKDDVNKNIPLEKLDIESVGKKTPADDFSKLLKHNVFPLTNNTLRDKKFNFYAAQLRSVVLELLRDRVSFEGETIAEAIRAYRSFCYEFNCFADFNRWLQRVKTVVIEQQLNDFWEEVIVKEQLGLCIVGEPSLEDKVKLSTFYKLSNSQGSDANTVESVEIY